MANITATFVNSYGDSRKWVIVDMARDPNSPPILFNDYLDPDQSTPGLTLYSSDGIYRSVQYQRSDGAPTMVDNVTDGSQVSMS